MTTLSFEHFPGRHFHLLLFKDVRNAKDIVARILARSLDPDVTVLDAGMVVDVFAVHLAAYKALCNASGPGLKTKTLHSEVVFMLSGGRHIVEAYRNFGPKDDTTALLVGIFDPKDGDAEKIQSAIEGQPVDIEELGKLQRIKDIHRAYKVQGPELVCDDLVGVVASRMGSAEV